MLIFGLVVYSIVICLALFIVVHCFINKYKCSGKEGLNSLLVFKQKLETWPVATTRVAEAIKS